MTQERGGQAGTIGGTGGKGFCGSFGIVVCWNAKYSDLRNVKVIRRHNVE